MLQLATNDTTFGSVSVSGYRSRRRRRAAAAAVVVIVSACTIKRGQQQQLASDEAYFTFGFVFNLTFLSIFSSFWSAKQSWVKLLSWRQWCYRLHSDTQTDRPTDGQTHAHAHRQLRLSNCCCCCCSARVKWMTHQQHPRVWQVAGRLLRLRPHKGNGSEHCVYNGFVMWRNGMEDGEGEARGLGSRASRGSSSSRYKSSPPRQMGTESITWCVCACECVCVCSFSSSRLPFAVYLLTLIFTQLCILVASGSLSAA